eukprot:1110287-Ditylum_brightwellii.AAC.1
MLCNPNKPYKTWPIGRLGQWKLSRTNGQCQNMMGNQLSTMCVLGGGEQKELLNSNGLMQLMHGIVNVKLVGIYNVAMKEAVAEEGELICPAHA